MGSKSINLLMIIALVLILGGGFLAYLVQTGGGDIDIRDIRFMGSNGTLMSALLYVPEGVSPKNKAPGILAIHGYINSRETQDGFAIEFARRGYVVLAMDQPGHGWSDPPAFNNAFGGIDGLNYLRSLDFVDTDNIGLEGHSMGGWSAAIAGKVVKGGYKSFVMASSSTGTFGAPRGTPTYPRNMALIFSKYDEFSNLMWGIHVPADIVNTDKLKKLFNTTEPVEVGKLYGSIEEGTARKLYQPSTIHPRVHFSKEAIGNAVEWMQMTLKGGNGLPPSDQTWCWKEFFTLLAMIGMVFLILASGGCLLQCEFFSELGEEPAPKKALAGWGWWVGAVITVLLPLPVYYWAWSKIYNSQGIAKATRFWPEQITTTIMFWALGVGVIALVLFLIWHFLLNRKAKASMADYGLIWRSEGFWPNLRKLGKSLLLAFYLAFIAHLSLAISDWLFKTDYRIWVFAIKPLDALHLGVSLRYIIPFAFYFLVLGLVLHGQMRPGKPDKAPAIGWEMVINVILLILGYFIFLAYHYIPLFAGGALGIKLDSMNLGGIVMFQFIPLFAIVGIITTYFYRKTGHIYVGAFTSAMLVTWTIVAGQAIHYAL